MFAVMTVARFVAAYPHYQMEHSREGVPLFNGLMLFANDKFAAAPICIECFPARRQKAHYFSYEQLPLAISRAGSPNLAG
jgi:hypothetical protein